MLAHPYSPDVDPSDYYLFFSMQIALSGERFNSHADTKNWLDNWIASKKTDFLFAEFVCYPKGEQML